MKLSLMEKVEKFMAELDAMSDDDFLSEFSELSGSNLTPFYFFGERNIRTTVDWTKVEFLVREPLVLGNDETTFAANDDSYLEAASCA